LSSEDKSSANIFLHIMHSISFHLWALFCGVKTNRKQVFNAIVICCKKLPRSIP